jgi:hypothetical protein
MTRKPSKTLAAIGYGAMILSSLIVGGILFHGIDDATLAIGALMLFAFGGGYVAGAAGVTWRDLAHPAQVVGVLATMLVALFVAIFGGAWLITLLRR